MSRWRWARWAAPVPPCLQAPAARQRGCCRLRGRRTAPLGRKLGHGGRLLSCRHHSAALPWNVPPHAAVPPATQVNASDTRGKSDASVLKGVGGKLANAVKELTTNRAVSYDQQGRRKKVGGRRSPAGVRGMGLAGAEGRPRRHAVRLQGDAVPPTSRLHVPGMGCRAVPPYPDCLCLQGPQPCSLTLSALRRPCRFPPRLAALPHHGRGGRHVCG